jgi:nicotinamide riboside kinase
VNPLLICLIGAECTGKTTLAQALATRMDGLWVPEYLRTFCDEHGRTPRQIEQAHILDMQVRQEDQALVSAEQQHRVYVFCDTAPLLTAIYSDCMFGDHTLYPRAHALHARYALTLHLAPDIPWVADGLQRDGVGQRARVHGLIQRELAVLRVPVVAISGTLSQRLSTAVSATRTVNDSHQ